MAAIWNWLALCASMGALLYVAVTVRQTRRIYRQIAEIEAERQASRSKSAKTSGVANATTRTTS